MHACRWSPVVFLLIVMTSTMFGCQGAGPQSQKIVLTEDVSLRAPSVEAPPQRLALSSPRDRATRDDLAIDAPFETRQQVNLPTTEIKTRLAKSTTRSPVGEPIVQRRIVAKEPTSSTVAENAPQTTPSQPKRSDAVAQMLSANRAATRSRQSASNDRAKTAAAKLQTATRSPPVNVTVAKTSRASTTKAGKTMKFSDLPEEVQQRAMKRLVASLSKEAVPTAQPSSVRRALNAALGELPTLAPLRKTTPEITPLRIAASNSAEPKTQPKKTSVAAKRSVLRDIQVSELVAPKRGSSTVGDLLPNSLPNATPKTDLVAKKSTRRVTNSNSIELPASREPAKKAIAKRSVERKPASKKVATSPAFALPPLGGVAKNTPKQSLAKLDVDSQSTQGASTQSKVVPKSTSPAVEAVVETEAIGSNEMISSEVGELAFSSLANEMNSVPHDLHRQRFRVSQVGLRNPEDYFADAEWNDTVQQAASYEITDRSNDVSTSSVVQGIPASQANTSSIDERKIQASSVNSVDVALVGSSKPTSPTPSYELPPMRTMTSPVDAPLQQAISFELPDSASLSRNLAMPVESQPAIEISSVPTATAEVALESDLGDASAELMSPQSMSDQDLYDALLNRLTDSTKSQTPAERNRRQIMARHLMVLAGKRDAAMQDMKGLSKEEQEFLRHQLEGLYAMVDPNGHPVAGRRFSSALPELRQATMYLSAAADALEVRGLEFCTEIEAYGQIKPFPSHQFSAGQPVILYCEIDNFTTRKTKAGYETHLKGSYDVYNEAGEKVVSQLLPEDKQISRKFLRDYFVAYQMGLPAKLPPGKYRLQLTMEDVGGGKYGQSEIEFEIAFSK